MPRSNLGCTQPDLAMNIIEDVPQQLNPVNLHEDNLVALPLINLFVEACHVIFLRKLDKNSMPHKRRSSFELLVLQYTLDNTLTIVRLEYNSSLV